MDFPEHFDQIFQQLNFQRLRGQLCDCVVAVGSRHFNAHRSVLAACSAHFRALFAAGDGGGGARVIELDGEVVTAEAFGALVDMMYTSTLTLGDSNIVDVLLAASHLHLNAVVKACKRYTSGRAVPLLPLGNRAAQKLPAQLPTPTGIPSRLRHPSLLQQLGLSLFGSALGGMQDNVSMRGADGEVERQASFASRCGHGRKLSSCLEAPEARQKHRAWHSTHTVEPHQTGAGRGKPFSPGFLKGDNRPKLSETVAAEAWSLDGRTPQDGAQVTSQSDCGLLDGKQQGQAKELCLREDKEAVAIVMQGDHNEGQVQVVVKSEPLASPEPLDETNDVASQAQGSEQVGHGLEKMELSPEGGDRNWLDPQPSMDCSHLLGGAAAGGGDAECPASNSACDGRNSCGISSFLSPNGFASPGLRVGAMDENSVLNTMGKSQTEGDASSYTVSLESGSSPLASVLFHSSQSQFLPGEAHPFGGDAQLDSLDFQSTQDHSGLGLHPQALPTRGTLACLELPGYRRITSKVSPDVTSEPQLVDPVHLQDAAASSPATRGGTPFSNGTWSEATPVPHVRLTRASADVLSKCKKALSEHNVLVVEGAKKYACKTCWKTFLTLTDCKKHIRVHTGERPYACLKCGKRFSQSSHLSKHSKTICLR